jgi:hypothetical protein
LAAARVIFARLAFLPRHEFAPDLALAARGDRSQLRAALRKIAGC